ncbi:NHL repeat containing protein [Meiothermus ruber DSM 1279]|uniref:NHL repeat containing protein n=1 Tax=Meiothermus ruber (strain ATCC 35948 / DSM 1279 / VKM B-1258 / 21) TaxID=504728 RepID=M9XBA5_MEIRD|nr:NHL repeat containing protein [Meiothermus ruber DSM 1279]
MNAKVSVTGPSGFNQNLTGSQTFTAIAAGTYTVTADKVANTDPLIRTAYSASVSSSPACVRNGQSTPVNVSYAQIPSSNKLWMVNGNPPSGSSPLLGFTASLLSSTATQSPSVSAGTVNLRDLTFDKDGNLWGIGGTTADPNLVRYPASSLGSSGSKTRDRSINIGGFSCSPGPTRLAFDASGNLWVSIPCANKVVRVAAGQLDASGMVTPGVEITGLNAPEGLAFDASSNLWIANAGAQRVVRFNASRLSASTSGPDLTIESKTPSPVINTLDANLLAFDASGNLWVMAFGANVLYRLTPTDQSGSGSKTLTPAIQVSVPVSAVLEGMAFDEGGGLWISYSAGTFARLSPAQLGTSSTSGSPTNPERIITSSSIGSAGGLALYPAPANLPLYHRLP